LGSQGRPTPKKAGADGTKEVIFLGRIQNGY
jgi:hypothetical protein